MTTPSNSYAEKIFSEHPISLWTLDEDLSDQSNIIPVDDRLKTIYGVSWVMISSVTKLNSYGSTSDYGYGFFPSNKGIPLVYGASQSMALNQSFEYGMVFPGHGFLNESGKYNDYTLEAWIQLNYPEKNQPYSTMKKILGTIASADGLYIHNLSLVLKIGDYQESHYLGELGRPMLVQIQVSKNKAILVVNGEIVISMNIDMSNISLPTPKVHDPYQNKYLDANWIGVGGISGLQIDAIALYPNIVPITVLKKRFAYGQAVQYPQALLAKYGGTSAVIDYSFANYSTNYNYPQKAKWSNGQLYNFEENGNILRPSQYPLPELVAYKDGIKVSKQQWKIDNNNTQNNILLASNSSYTDSYLYYEDIKFLQNGLAGISIDFDPVTSIDPNVKQLVFAIIDNSGNSLRVELLDNIVWINVGSKYTDGDVYAVDSNTITSVGLDIQRLIAYDPIAKDLFSTNSNISMFIGGGYGGPDNDISNFKGYINRINFLSTNDMNNIVYTDENTFNPIFTIDDQFNNYNYKLELDISYSLTPTKNDMKLHSYGYWQDYIPLTYLAEKDSYGNYSIDFMQINFNADNFYQENVYDYITVSPVSAFVSLQQISFGAKDNFSAIVPLSTNQYSEIVAGFDQKYEVANGTVMSLPIDIDINDYALVIRLESRADIYLDNIAIKNLEIASRTDSENSPIGTKFGTTIKPFSLSGEKNPFSIYKGSTPYLYNSYNSGILLCGTPDGTRGLRFSINEDALPNFNISTIQMFIRYPEEQFVAQDLVMEINSKTSGINRIKLYVCDIGNYTGQLKAYSVATDGTETEIASDKLVFYKNGKQVSEVTMKSKEWLVLSINIPKLLDFSDSTQYGIDLVGRLSVDNVSYFRVGENAVSQKVKLLTWDSITAGTTWSDLQSSVWSDFMYESFEDIQSIDPKTVYDMYLGINKIIVDDDSSQLLTLAHYSYWMYKNANWDSQIIKPV